MCLVDLWWINDLEQLRREQRPKPQREQLQLPEGEPSVDPAPSPEEDTAFSVVIIEDP